MLFNTVEYLLFLFLVAAVFFLLPQAVRWVFLLLASYYFYACWHPEYLLFIAFVTVISYGAGIGISNLEKPYLRKAILFSSIGSNLGLLFTLKYWNFLSESLGNVSHLLGYSASTLPTWHFLLPIGISFYTLQATGYVIDVYGRRTRAETHLGVFATFVAFFPQLAAGPIGRAEHLLPQFRGANGFDMVRLSSGLALILWGVFKKTVIADRLSIVVSTSYGNPQSFGRSALLLGTFFFAIQIYCDFSAYSDIAVGSGRILGYDLMTNFRVPYLAQTFRDFWRRWHISLSTWFRDYVYIPMGGNRVGISRWLFNILVVFALSGLWHGASWTFVIWGLLNGFYLIAEAGLGRLLTPVAMRLDRYVGAGTSKSCQTIVVFVAVMFAWVFFRAQSLADACAVLRGMIAADWRVKEIFTLGLPPLELLFGFYGILVLLIVDAASMKMPRLVNFYKDHVLVRQLCHVTLVYSMVFCGVFGTLEFIYFQF